MRLHRFYIQKPISDDEFDIADRDLIHQWKHVFRYNVGSQVILFDGSGTDFLCIISSIRISGATVKVLKSASSNMPGKGEQGRSVWVCLALVKKDNFEWAVQKMTEIGVTNIVPIICEHSEKRKLNMERMEKIAIEASEQSGRGDIPKVHQPTTIQNFFQSEVLPQDKVVFHPSGIIFSQYRNTIANTRSIVAFVGPEGGFSEKEIAFFKSFNIPTVSLGQQILRAETASVAVSALLII